ncbi:MAG TPA: hypothetical protein DCR16_02790 [Lachnospiraceae bacterium]|nr:hypothetical protein [Lachnospiraceae bacterium]
MSRLPGSKGRNAGKSFYKSSKPAEKKQEYRAGAQIYTAKMILLKYNPVSLGIIIVNLSGQKE